MIAPLPRDLIRMVFAAAQRIHLRSARFPGGLIRRAPKAGGCGAARHHVCHRALNHLISCCLTLIRLFALDAALLISVCASRMSLTRCGVIATPWLAKVATACAS